MGLPTVTVRVVTADGGTHSVYDWHTDAAIVAPGTYKMVREDQMEKIAWCENKHAPILTVPPFREYVAGSGIEVCQACGDHGGGCGWWWLVKEDT